MIITSLIVATTLLVGGTLIVTFWNETISWLKRSIQKVQEWIQRTIYGTKLFLRKMGNGFQETSKHYVKDHNDRWNETVTTREVSADQVPPEIRQMAQMGVDRDITNELAAKLHT